MSGNPFSKAVGRVVGDVVTGGLAETNIGGGVFKKIGGAVGTVATLGTSGNPYGSDGNPGVPSNTGGVQSPIDVLTSTGGAPLLASISMGVSPDDALASYFGQSKSTWQEWVK